MLMMMFIVNIMFLYVTHPMSMGLILILQTMLTATMTGMLMKSFWMSYILVITMLSGILVLFIYMASLASNEKFQTNLSMMMSIIIMISLSSLFLFLSMKMIIKNNYFSSEISLSEDFLFLGGNLSKMFSQYNLYIMIIMIMYLFFTMIVSNHLVNIFEGPMRMKF